MLCKSDSGFFPHFPYRAGQETLHDSRGRSISQSLKALGARVSAKVDNRVRGLNAAARKYKFVGHEYSFLAALPDQQLWLRILAAQQDDRGGISYNCFGSRTFRHLALAPLQPVAETDGSKHLIRSRSLITDGTQTNACDPRLQHVAGWISPGRTRPACVSWTHNNPIFGDNFPDSKLYEIFAVIDTTCMAGIRSCATWGCPSSKGLYC